MRKFFAAIFLFLILWAPAAALAAPDLDGFRQLPILHDGRVKPLESFARIELQRLSGADALPGMSATQWLAEVLFAPDQAASRKIIYIKSHPITQMLHLPDAENQRYSYDEISAAFEDHADTITAILTKQPNARTPIENDFVERYGAVTDFFQLLNSMTLLLPSQLKITAQTAKTFGLPPGAEVDYLQLLPVRDEIIAHVRQVTRAKGTNIERYNPAEKDMVRLAFYLSNTEGVAENNTLFRVIPSALEQRENWIAPWELVAGKGSPQTVVVLDAWRQLARAYAAQDSAAWHEAVQKIRAATLAQSHVSNWRLALEVFYHVLNLIPIITAAYAVAFLLLLWGNYKNAPRITYAAKILALVGLTGHAALVLARMLILMRPPVSSLYESLLFISLLIVALGILFSRKHPESLWITAFLGALILIISPTYAPDGDTMGVLIAVLNTNFWLATHVVCITTGYSTTLIAGTMAHAYLFRPSPQSEPLLRRTGLIALLFTSFGTLLGGIWADQSWGRFWGWDPKENGALLIVLWLVWALHGRMTKHMGAREFAAVLACGNIVVALSWFGVNLLGVGLHSYGFTNSAAAGLAAFCGMEILLIGGLYVRARRGDSRAV